MDGSKRKKVLGLAGVLLRQPEGFMPMGRGVEVGVDVEEPPC